MHKLLVLSAAVALLAAGCAGRSSSGLRATAPAFVTATLPPTLTPTSTPQPPTPIPSPTSAPIRGIATTQVYVRDAPSSAGAQLGLLVVGSTVQVLGKDAGGTWYQVVYAAGRDGRGWVAAQYLQVDDPDAVPVISGPASGPSGSILEQVNVRKGPGTDLDSVGTLNPKDVVALTGRSSDSAWLQIQFDAAPDGRGWVAASFVDAAGVDALPIVAGTGAMIGTATAAPVAATLPATVMPAHLDNDSAASPAAKVNISPMDAAALFYSSDVSAPEGDAADWIAFRTSMPNLTIALQCTGNGNLTTQLIRGSQVLQDWGGLACGQSRNLRLTTDQDYLLRVDAVAAGSQLQYVSYTLTISVSQ